MRLIRLLKLLTSIYQPIPICANDPLTLPKPPRDTNLLRTLQHLRYRLPQSVKRVIAQLPGPPLPISPEIFDPIQLAVELRIEHHQVSTPSHLLLYHPLLLTKIRLQLEDPSPTAILDTIHTSFFCVFLPVLVCPLLPALQSQALPKYAPFLQYPLDSLR